MFKIIVTILLVGAFFILFFKPKYNLKNKTVSEPEASTSAGFIEDTYRGPFVDHFIPPVVGDVGTFVAYSSIPEITGCMVFPIKSLEERQRMR